jgi:hypothetical protein
MRKAKLWRSFPVSSLDTQTGRKVEFRVLAADDWDAYWAALVIAIRDAATTDANRFCIFVGPAYRRPRAMAGWKPAPPRHPRQGSLWNPL